MHKFSVETASSVNLGQFDHQRQIEDSGTTQSTQNFVTCIHRAKLAGWFRNISVTWSKILVGHSLTIMVQNPCDEDHPTCKIDLKTWQFWGKKGLKSFKVEDTRVDVFWDLKSAKFNSSPEPTSDYYVALVSDQEVILLLGDQKTEAFKRTKSKPSSVDATLVHKKENVFAKNCFSTKTRLGRGEKEHFIIIESALTGPDDPEMWISIDGTAFIRVVNLHWRFRGNDTVLVDDVPVQIFWDVHDWLYNSQNSGPGTFIFKQGTFELDQGEPDSDYDGKSSNTEDSCSWELPMDHSSTLDFSHFLYAWRTE